jgi:predicted nucleic acid-binding Zn ribbon protein
LDRKRNSDSSESQSDANDRDFEKDRDALARLHEHRRVYKRGPAKMGDVVNDLIARRGYLQSKTAEVLKNTWQQIVGPQLARNTEVGNVRRNVLDVFAKNSVVMQELSFQKVKILKRLQATDCGSKIRDLRFRIG